VAAELAAFMKVKRDEIRHLVERASRLALAIQARPLELVLCHSDIHAGNLHITPDGLLYIVDWDNPVLAPKERDLMHFGGSAVWNSAHAALFYQGYGQVEIDRKALAYYRCERIIQDIAEFCKQLLLTDEGGANRQQSLIWFTGQFLPGHEVEIANNMEPA
jgi:spectinomycin phosphotransferase